MPRRTGTDKATPELLVNAFRDPAPRIPAQARGALRSPKTAITPDPAVTKANLGRAARPASSRSSACDAEDGDQSAGNAGSPP
jgi:hypothetical protein